MEKLNLRKINTMQNISFLLIILVFLPFVNAAYIDYDDNWAVNQGSDNDAVIWGGGFLDVGLNSLTSNADIVCWDWDGDGEYSHCYFETGVSMYECDDDYQISSEPNGNYESPSSLYDDYCTLGNGGCDHTILTGSSGENWKNTVDAIYFEDCDGSASYTHVDEKIFYVVDRHMYDCDNGGATDYDYEAYDTNWVNVKTDISCGSVSLDCDENHDGDTDGSNNVWSESGTPNNPCRTKNGYACDNHDDCISDDCDGNYIDRYRSHCMASNYFQKQYEDHYKCCTTGCEESWTEYLGNFYCSSGMECDYAGDNEEFTNANDMPYLCKKSDGELCSEDSDCLTGHVCCADVCAATCDPDIDVSPASLTFNIGQ